MENTIKVSAEIAGKETRFETGLLAQQAGGCVTLHIGDNVLFSAATGAKTQREGIDFFPLQVEYRDKFYAAGRFPGGYFKREARPSEKEILTARATDRPIRPLFPEGYIKEVQICQNLFSTDGELDTGVMSINAASAALTISELPFQGPIGAVQVGRVDGEFVINPTHEQIEKGDLNLTYVGTRELPTMIEGDAKEVTNKDMVAAMRLAQEEVVKLCDLQLKLRAELGLPEKVIDIPEADTTLLDRARELKKDEFIAALTVADKHERQDGIKAFKDGLKEQLLSEFEEMTDQEFFKMFDAFEIETHCGIVLDTGKRIDGRGPDDLRKLEGQVGLLPRTHGSAVFGRGETQALATVTLGTGSDSQSMDAVAGGPTEKKFMLHYNFPPYCVGECGRLGATSRREIGHGNLAERSLVPILPEELPYSLRIVSEIMGSNGSSSMASACAGTLALMDAGIPIKKPVAGISVGLFTRDDQNQLVIDILGAEDHCGNMDFKVCGTRDGITGFQVDLKSKGLKWELVEAAFDMAEKARMNILDFMESIIAEPRENMSPFAPRIATLMIDPDKIGLLIGPGGKNIRRITETYNIQIDIEDDGKVSFFAVDQESMDGAFTEVQAMTAEAEIGRIYDGTVKGIKDFGAFVEILPGKEGLVHISEMADYRVKSVEDICKMNDQMWVKCLNIDEGGKIRLSRKAAVAEMDEASADQEEETEEAVTE